MRLDRILAIATFSLFFAVFSAFNVQAGPGYGPPEGYSEKTEENKPLDQFWVHLGKDVTGKELIEVMQKIAKERHSTYTVRPTTNFKIEGTDQPEPPEVLVQFSTAKADLLSPCFEVKLFRDLALIYNRVLIRRIGVCQDHVLDDKQVSKLIRRIQFHFIWNSE